MLGYGVSPVPQYGSPHAILAAVLTSDSLGRREEAVKQGYGEKRGDHA